MREHLLWGCTCGWHPVSPSPPVSALESPTPGVFVFGFEVPVAVATSIVIQLAGVGTTALGQRREHRRDPSLAVRLVVCGAAGILAFLAGTGTGTLGIGGAEIHTSAPVLRCGVPTQVAIGTGTGAAAFTLLLAAAIVLGDLAGGFALSGIPAAVIGSMTARHMAHWIPGEGLRVEGGCSVSSPRWVSPYEWSTPLTLLV